MAYFISPISIGLGDFIVSLPAVQGLIDSGQDTYLVARSILQQKLADRIEGLRGVIQEDQFVPDRVISSNTFFNLRDHPLQINFWWGSPAFDRLYPGFKINDILEIICRDFGISANFERLKPLQFTSVSAVENKIVFVPGSDGTYKCWPKEYWLALASWFNSRSMEVIMIGEPDSSQAVNELLSHLTWLPTPEIAFAVDVISSAQAVVAVDTGLMHISQPSYLL
jgi:Glycosyltransferase family 9 (heptosyltransferase)